MPGCAKGNIGGDEVALVSMAVLCKFFRQGGPDTASGTRDRVVYRCRQDGKSAAVRRRSLAIMESRGDASGGRVSSGRVESVINAFTKEEETVTQFHVHASSSLLQR